MSSKKWLSIAEKKKVLMFYFLKKTSFQFFDDCSCSFSFKITSLASVSFLLSVSVTNVEGAAQALPLLLTECPPDAVCG